MVVLTVSDNIGHCFQSPACTSKYGNGDFCKWKIAIKWGKLPRKKNREWCPLLVMMLGNAFGVQCTFPNMESKGGWCSLLMMMFEVLLSGNTLPFPGYSMWNPWKGGWTAEIPDGFHGMVDGFHGFSTWIPYFFQMDSIIFQMDSMEFPHGFHMEWVHGIIIIYISYTIFRMESIWNDFME